MAPRGGMQLERKFKALRREGRKRKRPSSPAINDVFGRSWTLTFRALLPSAQVDFSPALASSLHQASRLESLQIRAISHEQRALWRKAHYPVRNIVRVTHRLQQRFIPRAIRRLTRGRPPATDG